MKINRNISPYDIDIWSYLCVVSPSFRSSLLFACCPWLCVCGFCCGHVACVSYLPLLLFITSLVCWFPSVCQFCVCAMEFFLWVADFNWNGFTFHYFAFHLHLFHNFILYYQRTRKRCKKYFIWFMFFTCFHVLRIKEINEFILQLQCASINTLLRPLITHYTDTWWKCSSPTL